MDPEKTPFVPSPRLPPAGYFQAQSSCRCKKSSGSRNLIVCIDGTSNKFGKKNTNIIQLYSQIIKTDGQGTYYNSGIGTYARPSWRSLSYLRQLITNKIDLAIAWNVEKVIQAAYRWLADEYSPGDQIYLFGFSRGAYQVRALAGMIEHVGLLYPGNAEQIPFAYELYASVDSANGESLELAKTFKDAFSRTDVRVHFVGVWDTVSSVGFIRGKTLPSTTSSSDHICYFRHALALDERRVKFLPEYVYGGRADESNTGHVKEVWFAGSHSDVGGGNRLNEKLQLDTIPLQWMRSEAITAGLRLHPAEITWTLGDLEQGTSNSLTLGWWLLELIPFKRLLYYNSQRHTYRPHWGGPRKILPGQKVHASVLFKTNYKPKARFWKNLQQWEEPMYWNEPDSHKRLSKLGPTWEKDIFDPYAARELLDSLRTRETLDFVDRLAFMAGFDEGRKAISTVSDAIQILTRLLRSEEQRVQLSAAVALCELDLIMAGQLLQGKTDMVLRMLKSTHVKSQIRACVSLPSLCKHEALRSTILTDDTLRTLKDLCRNEDADTMLQVQSTQALSLLVETAGVTSTIIRINAVSEMAMLLHDTKHDPVKVAVMNILTALTGNGAARSAIRNANAIPALVKLMKRNDHYVAPAAVEVLCALSRYEDTRETVLRSRAPTVLLDMLEHPSGDGESVAWRCLAVLGQYGDAQKALVDCGLVGKLANLSKSRFSDKSESAIQALISLAEYDNSVRSILVSSGALKTMIKRLRDQNHCLFAARSLCSLMQFEDIRPIVLKSEAPSSFVRMLKHGWFDEVIDDKGLTTLQHVLDYSDLRAIMIDSHAMETLSQLLQNNDPRITFAGLEYLRTFARYDDGMRALSEKEMVGPVMYTLRSSHQALRISGARTLHILAKNARVRATIVHLGRFELLKMLKSDNADAIIGAATALRALSCHEEICELVRTPNILRGLRYQVEEPPASPQSPQSPRYVFKEDVSIAISRLLTSLVHGIDLDTDLPHEPFDAPRKSSSAIVWAWAISTVLCCPCLLLCGLGQLAYQELLEEE